MCPNWSSDDLGGLHLPLVTMVSTRHELQRGSTSGSVALLHPGSMLISMTPVTIWYSLNVWHLGCHMVSVMLLSKVHPAARVMLTWVAQDTGHCHRSGCHHGPWCHWGPCLGPSFYHNLALWWCPWLTFLPKATTTTGFCVPPVAMLESEEHAFVRTMLISVSWTATCGHGVVQAKVQQRAMSGSMHSLQPGSAVDAQSSSYSQRQCKCPVSCRHLRPSWLLNITW